jgi:2-deoxy-D-gluconate 3-dehydrogenase
VGGPFDLGGKCAVVTGASRGIGAAIALGLARAGASVFGVSRTPPEAGLGEAIRETGARFEHLAIDLSAPGSVAAVVAAALTAFGRIDILVNNAALLVRSTVLDHSEADWDRVMDLNLKVPFQLAQACAREMIARQIQGRIINVGSIASFLGTREQISYAVSKHGIAGMTKALANELASRGINVNGVAPGVVKTSLVAHIVGDPARLSWVLSRIPQGRLGEPEDVAGAVVFLASDAARYVNGHLLPVDGGWLGR